MANLPTWTNRNGDEVQAVRITRMVEFEKDKWRIEHDEPHCESITVGKEFVEKAGGPQQEGFYVSGGQDGERWMSAAHFQDAYKRQAQDYDKTPEKGFVDEKAKAQNGPMLNQPVAQPTPAELAAEAAKRQQSQPPGSVQRAVVPVVPNAGNLPTERALEHAHEKPSKTHAAHK